MPEQSAIKIMVVDDDTFMIKLLNRILTRFGFKIAASFNGGRTALDWLGTQNNLVDLILLDLNMPEMDGVEFVRHLVEQSYAGSLILVSGEDDRMLQTAERLAQAHKIVTLGYLHKPVEPQKLEALLRKWTPVALSKPRSTQKEYDAEQVSAAIHGGALVNYYQPKVRVCDAKVIGVEALVRWRHPTDGMVFPDQFIGVAEAHDLIDDLTRVVFTSAVAQAKAWQMIGLNLRVAVNVSMNNLHALSFADFFIGQATQMNVAPSNMVLEVTESQLMRDLRTPLEVLARLRLKRFGLSIDDFGTGHSSLSQLRDIPFDELKIDHSFVHRACIDDTLRAMFDSSLHLGKQLGMEVVAEGVEDQADWDFLRNTECDLAQGYFIGRPMPAADLPRWIESWHLRMAKT